MAAKLRREPTLSVVIPIYNEEELVDVLHPAVTEALEQTGETWEIVYVNDGSTDSTLDRLLEHQAEDGRVVVVELSRNWGHQPALTAGLQAARGQAVMMKEALLKGNIHEIGGILDFGFRYKKQMAKGISNDAMDEIYETALKAGATGGKVSGAGGGGFMMFYCPANTRYAVKKALQHFGGDFSPYQFTERGLFTWSI